MGADQGSARFPLEPGVERPACGDGQAVDLASDEPRELLALAPPRERGAPTRDRALLLIPRGATDRLRPLPSDLSAATVVRVRGREGGGPASGLRHDVHGTMEGDVCVDQN